MQSNKRITGISEGRENGVEKYFKKQCLKTSQSSERHEPANINAEYIQRESFLSKLCICR